MDLLLLSNSTNYGETMFAHAAEAFVDVAAGDRVTFVPFALADWDGYADRAIAALGAFGIERRLGPPVRRRPTGPSSTPSVVMMGGGNTFRLLDSLLRPRRARRARRAGARAGPRATWARRPAPTWPARPSAPRTTCRSASRRRSTRSGLMPFQINLHYVDADPALDLHGRDPRGADRGVPRGERLPGARPVRGLVAAGAAAIGRRSPGPPACSGGRAARRFADGVDVSHLLDLDARVRRRRADPGRGAGPGRATIAVGWTDHPT